MFENIAEHASRENIEMQTFRSMENFKHLVIHRETEEKAGQKNHHIARVWNEKFKTSSCTEKKLVSWYPDSKRKNLNGHDIVLKLTECTSSFECEDFVSMAFLIFVRSSKEEI